MLSDFPSILRNLWSGQDRRKQNKYVFKCHHEQNDTPDLNKADPFVTENSEAVSSLAECHEKMNLPARG